MPAANAQGTILNTSRFRLLFLDGVRGLAAVYVLLLHSAMEADDSYVPTKYTGVLRWVAAFCNQGRYAVAVFIALSGYSLMLPVVRTDDGQLQGGWRKYAVRRMRRILPPYYASLAVSLLLIALIPSLHNPQADRFMLSVPAFTPGPLLSHLFLVHNFVQDYASRINPPMWSVPPECDIYILFPLILLPVWRQWRVAGLVIAGLVLGVGPHWIPGQPADYLYPWFITVFTFGAAAAALNAMRPERKIQWGLVVALTAVPTLALIAFNGPWAHSRLYISDTLVGLSVAALIGWMASDAKLQRRNIPAGLLSTGPLAWLGTISYSVYLIHYPLLPPLHAALRSAGWSQPSILVGMLCFGTILSLAAAQLFHLIFERPFLRGHPKTERRVEIVAAIDPAP